MWRLIKSRPAFHEFCYCLETRSGTACSHCWHGERTAPVPALVPHRFLPVQEEGRAFSWLGSSTFLWPSVARGPGEHPGQWWVPGGCDERTCVQKARGRGNSMRRPKPFLSRDQQRASFCPTLSNLQGICGKDQLTSQSLCSPSLREHPASLIALLRPPTLRSRI